MTYQSLPNINLADIPRAKLGVASGVYNTCRQIGLTVSAAVLLSVLYAQLAANLMEGHVQIQVLDAFKASWLYAMVAAFFAWLSTLLFYTARRQQ